MKRAIDTEYRGHRFRSRLEARWAVFFDHAGFDWRYESEGYPIHLLDGSSRLYLPDFWLPKHGLWVEVKGEVTLDVILQMAACAIPGAGLPNVASDASRSGPRIVLVGELPEHGCEPVGVVFSFLKGNVLADWHQFGFIASPSDDWMDDTVIAMDCGTVRHDLARELAWDFDLAPSTPGNSIYADAADAARKARFEHGARPSRVQMAGWPVPQMVR